MSIPIPERSAEEQFDYWFERFDQLDPGEYLSLYRLTTDPPEIPSQLANHQMEQLGLEYWVVGNYLQALPSRNFDRAIAVYEAFARSPRVEDRIEIARGGLESLGWLARVDRTAGLNFWDRLVRDPDSGVRDAALCEFIEYRTGVVAARDDDLAEAGITRADAEGLAYAYLMAEQGQNLHDPLRHAGELAMRHLVAIEAPGDKA